MRAVPLLGASEVDGPQQVHVVLVALLVPPQQEGGGQRERVQVVSEQPVRLEEGSVLPEERQHLAPLGELVQQQPA